MCRTASHAFPGPEAVLAAITTAGRPHKLEHITLPQCAFLLCLAAPPAFPAAPQLMPSAPCTGIENWNQGQCPQEAIWDEGAAILDRSQKGAGWGMAINPVSRRGQHQVRLEGCRRWRPCLALQRCVLVTSATLEWRGVPVPPQPVVHGCSSQPAGLGPEQGIWQV
jgi:hypothetical protein